MELVVQVQVVLELIVECMCRWPVARRLPPAACLSIIVVVVVAVGRRIVRQRCLVRCSEHSFVALAVLLPRRWGTIDRDCRARLDTAACSL